MVVQNASIIKRAIAYVIDSFIVAITSVLLLFGGYAITGKVGFDDLTLQICVSIWLVIFNLIQLVVFNGKTLGKALLKLRVVDMDTEDYPEKTSTYVKRVLSGLGLIQFLTIVYPNLALAYVIISMIIAFKDTYSQSIWDKIANTMVIDER